MEQPSYYSILTANVRYDPTLKANEKLLFSEITALSNKYGYCTASNGYFAKLYNVSKVSISNWIKHLKEQGYLNVKVYRDTKRVCQRKIYPIAFPQGGGIKENFNRGIKENFNRGIKENFNRGIKENFKENITSNNNTSNNISSSKKEEDQFFNQIIDAFKKETYAEVKPYQRNQIIKIMKKIPKDSLEDLVDQIIGIMPVTVKDPTAYFIKSLQNGVA